MRGVAAVRHSRHSFSGNLTGVLREAPVAPISRVGVGGAGRLAELRGATAGEPARRM